MIGSRLPKNRKFSYESYYYDPKKEEKEGRRLKFKRKTTKSSAKVSSLIWLITLLALVIYMIYFLSSLGRN